MANKFYWHGQGEQGGPEPSFEAVKKHLIASERRGNFTVIGIIENVGKTVEEISL